MDAFFGQAYEDYLAYHFFGRRKHGFYVDVGASDGIRFSNSFVLEKRGWSGICVEAHPFYYNICKKNRKKAKVYNVAIGDTNGTATFYASKHGALSSLDPSAGKIFKKQFKAFKGYDKEIKMPVRTINSLLEENNVEKVDYITIDIEGTELDAMRGFDLSKYDPELLIIEACTPKRKDALIAYMQSRGYVYARPSGSNYIFCKTKEAKRKLLRIPPIKKEQQKLRPHVLKKKEMIRAYNTWLRSIK